MGEISLHCKEHTLGAVFGVGELHSTPLHVLQLDLVCPIPMYVSDYPRVFEVNQGIVDKEVTSGQGMENVEVSVFDSSPVEIRRRKGLSMKGGGILLIALATDANKMSVFIDASVADISGSFCLSFLVKEDDGIKMGLSAIIPYPAFSRVVGILKVASKQGSKVN